MPDDGALRSDLPGNEHITEYLQKWAESVAFVLGQISGKPFAIRLSNELPLETADSEPSEYQATVVAAGAIRGEMGVRVSRKDVVAVAQLFLGDASNPEAQFQNEHQEAFEEFLRQVAGYVATSIKPVYGDVQLRMEPGAPSWPEASAAWLCSGEDSLVGVRFRCLVSAALQASLATAGSSGTAAPQREPPSPSLASEPATQVGFKDDNLDLLLDVELDVTLRFGARNMPLRDILELGAGAVVELDRRIEEPADLLLDGRIIARGEVVEVDGNYGLRVLEVILPRNNDSASREMRA